MTAATNPLQDFAPKWLTDMPQADASTPALARTHGPKMPNAARFVCWAFTLRAFPTVQDIMARWDCSRATAYRWRASLADGFGLVLPPNPAGIGCAASSRAGASA